RKPMPAGVDCWSHWEHGPDNNPYSNDKLIRAPYLTQFLGKPYYIAMPSITTAAGGRTFLAMGHIAHHRREEPFLYMLMARNGYNGTVLWTRKLPEGYMVHRSAYVATPDTFYLMGTDHCLLLDPVTGEEKGRIEVPGLKGQWHWMAIQDGVLYVLAGGRQSRAVPTAKARLHTHWSWADLSPGYYAKPRVPWGFGDTIAAYCLKRKQTLWLHEESQLIDSRAMAVGPDRLFLYCPAAHVRALRLSDGKVLWTNGASEVLELIESPGRGLISTPGFRSQCMAVYAGKALVIQGQTRMFVVALASDDGRLLWHKKKVTNNPNVLYVDGRIIVGVGPGGNHVAIDPESGKVLADLGFRKR
ncbi:MAG TPA: hypothetical protein EYP14_05700, partial [Planctomycetaceae bacterium]|nr:hypothetical protein [Planctomycetaceae bacterium]